MLILHEIDENTKALTGRTIKKTVTFVRKTKEVDYWPQNEI